jgi:uroporphyrinogen decarboxylase
MSKQNLIDAYRGKRPASVPWVPYSGVHSAFLINEPADKFLKDPQILAKGVVAAAKRYHADGVPLLFDLSVEANAVGCDLKWWPDNVPSVTNHPLSDKSLADSGLKLPTKDSGRWPTIIEAAKIAKPQLDEMDCVMMGLLCGPLTLGSHLAGVRIFTDVYKNKAKAHEVIKFAGEVGAVSAKLYADMGCDIIAIVDPVASQIKPETFREFVTPNSQAAIKVIHDAGKTSSFFICGDCTKVMEEVCKIGTHGFAIDEQLNLLWVRDMACCRHGKMPSSVWLPEGPPAIPLPLAETCLTMFRWNIWIKPTKPRPGLNNITPSILKSGRDQGKGGNDGR